MQSSTNNNIIEELLRVWGRIQKNFILWWFYWWKIKSIENYKEFVEEFKGLDLPTNILINEKSLVNLGVFERVHEFFKWLIETLIIFKFSSLSPSVMCWHGLYIIDGVILFSDFKPKYVEEILSFSTFPLILSLSLSLSLYNNNNHQCSLFIF